MEKALESEKVLSFLTKGRPLDGCVRDLLLPGDMRQGHKLPLGVGKGGMWARTWAGWEDGTWQGSVLPPTRCSVKDGCTLSLDPGESESRLATKLEEAGVLAHRPLLEGPQSTG